MRFVRKKIKIILFAYCLFKILKIWWQLFLLFNCILKRILNNKILVDDLIKLMFICYEKFLHWAIIMFYVFSSFNILEFPIHNYIVNTSKNIAAAFNHDPLFATILTIEKILKHYSIRFSDCNVNHYFRNLLIIYFNLAKFKNNFIFILFFYKF